MYCINCNKKVQDTDKFCPFCGSKTIMEENMNEEFSVNEASFNYLKVPEKKRSGKGKWIGLILGIIVVVVALGFVGKKILGSNFMDSSLGQTQSKVVEGDMAAVSSAAEKKEEALNLPKKIIRYKNDESIDHWYEYEYDDEGKKIKAIEYDADGIEGSWNEYEYDDIGKILKRKIFDNDGNIVLREEWEYDENGREIKVTLFNYDFLSYWTLYEYNHKGEKIKSTFFDREGNILETCEFEYNRKGKKIKSVRFDNDGSKTSWCEHSYDKKGNILKEDMFDASGKLKFVNEYDNSYDENGNLLKVKKYQDGKLYEVDEYYEDSEESVNLTDAQSTDKIINDSESSSVLDISENEPQEDYIKDFEGTYSGIPKGYTPISTAEELQNINNNLSGKYYLMNDIDLADYGAWTPIGQYDIRGFTGIFDGGGHEIKNIAVEVENKKEFFESYYAGLFAKTSEAEIRNVGISNGRVVISSFGYSMVAGGIVGYSLSETKITNCYNAASIAAHSLGVNEMVNQSTSSVGGIVGEGQVIIENCFNMGIISSYDAYSGTQVGGIIGCTSHSSISQCYNKGLLFGKEAQSNYPYLGGLIGYEGNSNDISSCYYIDSTTDAAGHSFTEGYHGIPLSEEEMAAQDSFEGFDFENVWSISSEINSGFPYLKVFH